MEEVYFIYIIFSADESKYKHIFYLDEFDELTRFYLNEKINFIEKFEYKNIEQVIARK